MARKTIVAAVVIAICAAAPAAARSTEDARDFLQSLANETIAILADGALSQHERERALGDVFDRGFHLPTISRFALGRYWRTTKPAQQEEYQTVFRDFIIRSTSRRFSTFAGERVEVQGARQETATDTMVASLIGLPGEERTRVIWRVREISGEYKIIDVIVEGVSMLITQRDEFSSVIRNSGGSVDGLISSLRDKVRELE